MRRQRRGRRAQGVPWCRQGGYFFLSPVPFSFSLLLRPCLQGTERVPGSKESDSNQARPAGSSDATPDSAIWPRYQDIGDMRPRGEECFSEAG